jgi:hypothetical protein
VTAFGAAVADGLTITRRNLIKIKRVPDLIVFATLSPIMFVLLFRYVFGGAIGGLPPGPASPRTCRRGSSTGSARCRWPAPPSWWGAPSPTSGSTPSRSP